MNYKEKYLLYKKKYLNLKSQNGGNTTFRIYTTGICSWGNLDAIFTYWQLYLCSHICSIIPCRFTSIEIIHSDILLQLAYMPIINVKQVEKEINNKLYNDYKIDSRISKNIFQREGLDFNKISKTESYIILDFAHIFYYSSIHTQITPFSSSIVFTGSHYNEPFGQPINLNIIYLGYILYIGNPRQLPSLYNEIFFKINDDNTIDTIYTKLLNEQRFNKIFEEFKKKNVIKSEYNIIEDPQDMFYVFVNYIRSTLGLIFKDKFGNYDLFDKYLGLDKFNDSLFKLTIEKDLFNYIMNDIITEDEIITLIHTKIYREIITKENIEKYDNKYYLIK